MAFIDFLGDHLYGSYFIASKIILSFMYNYELAISLLDS